MTASVGVGLIGLGTVGTCVARRLVDEWELLGRRAGAIPVLRRIAVRDASRARGLDLGTVSLDADPEALVDDDRVEIVVELMGGVDRAGTLVETALRAGKSVVTANKSLIAQRGDELSELARRSRATLRYEAAVGAGVPVVAMLRDSLAGDRVAAIEMVINGTTNFILTRMEKDSLSFAEALRAAQARGFAEADASSDVDGHDAAAKLVVLARLGFGMVVQPSDVATAGIGMLPHLDIACAASLGASIKLVALATQTAQGLALSVCPTVVRAGHPLHGVDDAENAVVITSDLAGRLVVRGSGAGGEATASAIVNDVVQTVRHRAAAAPPAMEPTPAVVADGSTVERGGYIRVQLNALAEADRLVEQALQDRGLPVQAATLVNDADGRPAQIAMLTSPTARSVRDNAVETLDSLAAVRAVASVMDAVGLEQ